MSPEQSRASLESLPSELLDTIFDLAHSIEHRLAGPVSKRLAPFFYRTVYREIYVEGYDAFTRLCETAYLRPELFSYTRRLDVHIPIPEPADMTVDHPRWREDVAHELDAGSDKHLFECLTRLEELEIFGSAPLALLLLGNPGLGQPWPFTTTLVALDITSTFGSFCRSEPFACLEAFDSRPEAVFTKLTKLSINAWGNSLRWYPAGSYPPGSYADWTPRLFPSLEELSLTGPISKAWDVPRLLARYSDLTSLALNETGESGLLMNRLNFVRHPTKIRHLELWLSNDDAEPDPDDRDLSLLARFVNLDSLVVQGHWCAAPCPEFEQALAAILPLSHLSFGIDTVVSAKHLETLIESRRVKRITLDHVDSVRGERIPREFGPAEVADVDLIGLGWTLPNWYPLCSRDDVARLIDLAGRKGVVLDGYAVEGVAVEAEWDEEVKFYREVMAAAATRA